MHTCVGRLQGEKMGLDEGCRTGSWQRTFLHLLTRLSGKLWRVGELRAKRARAVGTLFKSQKRNKKVASRLEFFPLHGILHIFYSNTYLAFYSDLYPKGYTYSPLFTGLRINEDIQK